MLDLRELYQELIIDHGRTPRQFRIMTDANYQAEGFNPLCGDQLTLYLRLDNGIIQDASFTGTGCAISTASASLMVEQLKGKTVVEANHLFKAFHQLLTSGVTSTGTKSLGKLIVLASVRDFPTRVKCATLAWHTLQAALTKSSHVVSTEG